MDVPCRPVFIPVMLRNVAGCMRVSNEDKTHQMPWSCESGISTTRLVQSPINRLFIININHSLSMDVNKPNSMVQT